MRFVSVILLALFASVARGDITCTWYGSPDMLLHVVGDADADDIDIYTYVNNGNNYFVVRWKLTSGSTWNDEWDSRTSEANPIECEDVKEICIQAGAGDDDIDVTYVQASKFTTIDSNTQPAVGQWKLVCEGEDGYDEIWASQDIGTKMTGGDDTDYLWGADGPDALLGGDDTDYLRGNANGDWIYGGPGDDYCWGHAGNDWIYGEAGSDTLHGGEDIDHIYGGTSGPLVGTTDLIYDNTSGEDGDDAVDYIYANGTNTPEDTLYYEFSIDYVAKDAGDTTIDTDP